VTANLGFAPSEDPFVVEHGGFYRRWFSMIDDIAELEALVGGLKGTTEDHWVPVWREAGRRHEEEGDRFEERGDVEGARRSHLQAKTFYSIARFPGEITPLKAEVSADCARAYRKACAHLDPPLEAVAVECDGRTIAAHFRAPNGARPDRAAPAVLVMCGADVFKEDRGWAGAMALDEGMASLVMDGPGTGENPFPWDPSSVKAWIAAVDYLAARPEVDATRIGAFGISRGGYSVLQLAGTYPNRVGAVVAIAGHPFGYRMSEDELDAYVDGLNRRAAYVFGEPDGPPTFPTWSRKEEDELFDRWALSKLGVLETITQPVLMINGKRDHLAPIGNIYYMFEHGPVTGREARIYPDAGHCAFKYFKEWAPASFAWIRDKLG
jgi:dienelactone hydrolase